MYDLIFIARNVNSVMALKEKLNSVASARCYSICFSPDCSLLLEGSVEYGDTDLTFEPFDAVESGGFSMLMVHDDVSINGRHPDSPLIERLSFIQELAQQCVCFSEKVELYLSDNNGFLPDFIHFDISVYDVAQVIYGEYKKNRIMKTIPNVHVVVSEE